MSEKDFEILDQGWLGILEAIEEIEQTEIVVGVLGEAGSDLVNIAFWNHQGTRRNGVEHIPARPFFQVTLDRVGELLEQLQGAALGQVHAGLVPKHKIAAHLKPLGAWLAGEVQQTIADGVEPENADSTIARKGHTRTLVGGGKYKGARVVGGRLRQSISFDVRPRS